MYPNHCEVYKICYCSNDSHFYIRRIMVYRENGL
nr:MAG TPA: hypothetical protein [Caudoviricetes sp.]